MKKTPKKKSFSSFDTKTAFQHIGLQNLLKWQITAASLPPSDFFQKHWQRLEQYFNLTSERERELLIDALCEEAISYYSRLKIWKSAPLEGATTTGVADYVIAVQKAYLDTPLLCVVEAKRDDFEQGEAQCLVELHVCDELNRQASQAVEVFGIVTNGKVWQFYKWTTAPEVYASLPYSIQDLAQLLGVLHWIFGECEAQLAR
jgi:hypothetical protein